MSLENNETFDIEENDLTEPSEDEFGKEINTDYEVQSESSEFSDEENFEDDDESEEQKSKKSSKIFLYVIYAIVIILCLVVLGKNLLFKNSSNKNDSSAASSESAVINAPKKIEDLYILADLPEEYELTNQVLSDTKAISTYNNKKNEVVLTQSTIDAYDPEYDVNDKDIVISDFYNGLDQEFKAYQIDGKCYIVWTTAEYTFEIKTTMKKSESIPFVINVQKAEEASSASESE